MNAIPVNLWNSSNTLVIACASGMAAHVETEVRALGYPVNECGETTVITRGTMIDAMRLNLWLRSAQRVLWPIRSVRAHTLLHLYEAVSEIAWEDILDVDGRFSVGAYVLDVPSIRDTRMPALKAKDAIADRFRRARGSRPDSDNTFEGAAVFIYWREDDLRICIDTTGEPLTRRGYRLQPGAAPMQEALAAGCIIASGWKADTPFVVPMCGSGTPAIEAALIARRRAPGSFRNHFAFMALKGFGDRDDAAQARKQLSRGVWLPQADGTVKLASASVPPPRSLKPASAWHVLVTHARSQERTEGLPMIIATDINPDAVHGAEANAGMAGVRDMIRFSVCDFADTPLPATSGILFMNPEYGERLGTVGELEPLYVRIGAFIRARCAGWRTFILAGNRTLSVKIGLKASSLQPVFNGPIECRLLEFEVYGD
jgi:putative N6-adenine-specific DNA methylase